MKIKTIHQLSKLLSAEEEHQNFESILKNVAFSQHEIEPLCFWDTDAYSKILVGNDTAYELILMCWEARQETPIHNHNGQESWILVLDGELKEELFSYKKEILQSESIKIIKKNVVSHINDKKGIHQVKNNTNKRTISLHLFTNSIGSVNTYDLKTGKIIKSKLHN